MSAEAVAAVGGLASIVEPSLELSRQAAAAGGVAGMQPDFGDMFAHGIDAVNRQLLGDQVELQNLALGNVQNLHQVMIRLEESRLSFQLLMQVRNRVLEAYQDVMKMQV